MNFTLRQLRAFTTLARTGSFTRAAAELHLSQPALTVQVRDLEAALGLKLVDRNTRSIRLTGVAAQDLRGEAAQTALFPDAKAARRREVESTLLRAKGRFGPSAITFATLLEDTAPRAAPEGDLTKRR